MPRFPKLAVRRYCPRESMVPPASPDGPAVIRQRRAKRSDGFETNEPCPACGNWQVAVLNLDMQHPDHARRYACSRCGHKWGR